MNYKNENVLLSVKIVNKLRNKYIMDNFDRNFSEILITKVCFAYPYKKDSEKAYLYLKELSFNIDKMLNEGESASVIFNELMTIACNIVLKISSNELSISDIENKEKDSFKEGTKYSINNRLSILKDTPREELELYERYQVLDSLNKYSHYKDKTARGRIIGSLNRGFYGMSQDEVFNHLKEKGIKCSKKDRFVSLMNDDMLRYRIVLMEILRVYTKKGKEKKLSLDKMRDKTKLLGEIGREMFEEKYNMSPLESLEERAMNPETEQIEFDFMKDIRRVRK